MSKDKITEAMGRIDDELLAETAIVRSCSGKQPKRSFRWGGIVAACVCVALAVVLWKTGVGNADPEPPNNGSFVANTQGDNPESKTGQGVVPIAPAGPKYLLEERLTIRYLLEECLTIQCSITPEDGDLHGVTVKEYEKALSEVLEYVQEIDKDFDMDHYRLSVVSRGDDGFYTLELAYQIDDNIFTEKGFSFIGKNGILESVSYQRYYRDGWPEVDEAALINMVNADMEEHPLENVSREDYEKREHYSYSYMTGELKRVTEIFRLEGDFWIDSGEERVLN